MLATEVRSGDAPKPPFSMKSYNKLRQSGNQVQINHRNVSLFLSLCFALLAFIAALFRVLLCPSFG